jgi:hypothetical protein
MTKLLARAAYAWAMMCGLVAGIPQAAAQGCAMCYQNAAATGPRGRTALQHGILILLVPAGGLFAGILALLWRRRVPDPKYKTDTSHGQSNSEVLLSMLAMESDRSVLALPQYLGRGGKA